MASLAEVRYTKSGVRVVANIIASIAKIRANLASLAEVSHIKSGVRVVANSIASISKIRVSHCSRD